MGPPEDRALTSLEDFRSSYDQDPRKFLYDCKGLDDFVPTSYTISVDTFEDYKEARLNLDTTYPWMVRGDYINQVLGPKSTLEFMGMLVKIPVEDLTKETVCMVFQGLSRVPTYTEYLVYRVGPDAAKRCICLGNLQAVRMTNVLVGCINDHVRTVRRILNAFQRLDVDGDGSSKSILTSSIKALMEASSHAALYADWIRTIMKGEDLSKHASAAIGVLLSQHANGLTSEQLTLLLEARKLIDATPTSDR